MLLSQHLASIHTLQPRPPHCSFRSVAQHASVPASCHPQVAADENGKSKGYGFVHFEAEDSAKQAIERVNGMKIGENTVTVEKYMKATDRDAEPKDFTNLYVKNMPKSWDEAKLKEMFAEFGTVTSTLVQKDPSAVFFGRCVCVCVCV